MVFVSEASSSTLRSILHFILVYTATTAVLVSIVYLNILFLEPVDYIPARTSCTCDCWDRQFKGEYWDDTKMYRAVYFNMTPATLRVFGWTILYALLIEQYARRCVDLVTTGRFRYALFVLSLLAFYGHYYNWWCTWNYLNDEFYPMFNTQMFFNATEFVPTALVYLLLEKGAKVPRMLVLASMSVSILHLFLALHDQGWYHLLTLSGKLQRDMGFLLSDTILLGLTIREFRAMRGSNKELLVIFGMFFGMFVFYKMIE